MNVVPIGYVSLSARSNSCLVWDNATWVAPSKVMISVKLGGKLFFFQNSLHISLTPMIDYKASEPYKTCEAFFKTRLSGCVFSCELDDIVCLAVCRQHYQADLKKCPCSEQCPSGCPCPEYQCPVITTAFTHTTNAPTTNRPTTTTEATTAAITSDSIRTTEPQTTTINNSISAERTSMLILSTKKKANYPVVLNVKGESYRPFNFELGNAVTVSWSCSLTWKNNFYIFGGWGDQNKQISKLVGCKMTRLGSLSFDFYAGGCANMNNRRLFLCFDYSHTRDCHYADEPESIYHKTQ